MRRLDRAAALAAAAGTALCAAALFARGFQTAEYAEIAVNGKIIMKIPLDTEPRDITVKAGGGFNVVRVGEGRAAVVSADCPDLVCVRTGEISRPGEGAVCLPHRLVLRVTGEPKGGPDAVSE